MEDLIPNSVLFNRVASKQKKQVCPLSNVDNELIDYKNIELLKKYISEKGKILPSRVTGVSSKKQRVLRKSIQIARHIALLPYTTL